MPEGVRHSHHEYRKKRSSPEGPGLGWDDHRLQCAPVWPGCAKLNWVPMIAHAHLTAQYFAPPTPSLNNVIVLTTVRLS